MDHAGTLGYCADPEAPTLPGDLDPRLFAPCVGGNDALGGIVPTIWSDFEPLDPLLQLLDG